jgi:transposase
MAAQKKSPIASERDEGARDLWRWLASRLDLRRLVFVDESGTHISMDRLRSRAPRGQRAYGRVPKNRGKNMTLIASMSLEGMGESMCIEGATDAKAFEAYVEYFLAPSLTEGQVIVMDNLGALGAHRPGRVRELIEARGAELVFVPSYSPDLNPIEQAFSKIKNILRKLGARTHEALLEAMEEALSKVTPADAVGWFNHCGYEVEVQYL